MNNKWQSCTIADLGTVITGKTPSTSNTEYWGNEYQFITPKDIQTSKHILQTDRAVSVNGLRAVYSSVIPKNAICVSCIGNIGYVAMTTDVSVTNQQINSIVPNKDNDNDFVYYLMKSLWSYFKNYEGQSTALSILNKSQFSSIKIQKPDLQTQKKIASILSALDDKIELNTGINKNLEAQAQALFKSWFIDFEPFGGVMPAYWNKIRLEELCSLVSRGYNTKYVPKSNLINLNQKANRGTYIEKKYYKYLDESIPLPQEKFAYKGDILINSMGVGTVGRIHLWNNELANVAVDQCITIVRAQSNIISPEYLYLTLTSPEYTHYLDKNTTGSTGMISLNIKAVRDCKIFVPDESVLSGFNNIVKPIYDIIASNLRENYHLDTIRDTLLPKLMSGEIDVSKVELFDYSCLDKLSFSEETE